MLGQMGLKVQPAILTNDMKFVLFLLSQSNKQGCRRPRASTRHACRCLCIAAAMAGQLYANDSSSPKTMLVKPQDQQMAQQLVATSSNLPSPGAGPGEQRFMPLWRIAMLVFGLARPSAPI